MALVTKSFSDIITFTRASGATWFNSAGILQGVDFSVTSNTIGTGSKTFTLTATGGVNRYWTAGDTVLISDQANSANNMVGTVSSYNASTQVLVCDITSTGGSGTLTAWRIGSTMPRFDYNPSTLAARGLLIEEARTNLLLRSAEFDNALWTAIVTKNVTPNTDTAPDGTLTADTVSDSSAAAFQGIFQTVTVAADTTTYTASIYVKKTTGGTSATFGLNLQISGGTTVVTAPRFNTDTGTVLNGTASVQNAGSYWRFVVSVTNNGSVGNTNLALSVYPATAAYNSGVDTSTATGSAVVWGAQIEAGAFPTSYIPTTVAQVTRSADVASVNTLSPWFNSASGTLYAEYAVSGFAPASAFPSTAALSDGTGNNRINLASANTGVSLYSYGEVQAGGAPQAGFYGASGSPFGVGTARKVAIAYAVNDFAFTTQGLAVQADPSGTVPTVDRLYLGVGTTGTAQFQNGYLRRITYYPRRLSNAELQALTA